LFPFAAKHNAVVARERQAISFQPSADSFQRSAWVNKVICTRVANPLLSLDNVIRGGRFALPPSSWKFVESDS
jgi:hypothetical protein